MWETMTTRSALVTCEPIDEIPATASVCDFDEIRDPVGGTILAALGDGASTVNVRPAHAAAIEACRCDVVKFTDYYRIRRIHRPTGGR